MAHSERNQSLGAVNVAKQAEIPEAIALIQDTVAKEADLLQSLMERLNSSMHGSSPTTSLDVPIPQGQTVIGSQLYMVYERLQQHQSTLREILERLEI
jgi:uncharacterized coiled-coil protein SlyX